MNSSLVKRLAERNLSCDIQDYITADQEKSSATLWNLWVQCPVKTDLFMELGYVAQCQFQFSNQWKRAVMLHLLGLSDSQETLGENQVCFICKA